MCVCWDGGGGGRDVNPFQYNKLSEINLFVCVAAVSLPTNYVIDLPLCGYGGGWCVWVHMGVVGMGVVCMGRVDYLFLCAGRL